MKDNAQILKEVLIANGISRQQGGLGGKSEASDFVRRVIQEGNVDQAIHYDDGMNGPRDVRPVQIVNSYAYHDCLGELVKAGARMDFDPYGYGNNFGDMLCRRAEKEGNSDLQKALKGEIGIGLGSGAPVTAIQETDLEEQLRAALLRSDAKASIAAIDAGANPHIKIEGASTLHRAVRISTELVDKILDHGVPIDSPDSNNYRPLHKAASLLDSAASALMVEHLLDRGANPHAGAWAWENTPLHSEISNERPKSTIALINIYAKRKLDLDKPDKEGKTALHLACMVGLNDVVQTLIDNGANRHAIDNLGRTPLHYAALRGNEVATRALLKADAKPNVQDKDGNTPLHLCYSGEQTLRDLFQMLEIDPEREASAIGNKPNHLEGRLGKPDEPTVLEASMSNRNAIASTLMMVGARQDIENNAGNTPGDMPGYRNSSQSIAGRLETSAGIGTRHV